MHTADTNVLESPSAERQAKLAANLIAQLAFAGHAVHKSRDGSFLVCKQGLSKHCADTVELQAFAVKLGVKHG